jgi:hypothetical protein
VFLFSPIHGTCPDHLIILISIILIILVEDYKLWSFSLCSFLYSPVTSFLFSQIFPSALFSQTPSAYIPPSMSETKFLTNREAQAKL